MNDSQNDLETRFTTPPTAEADAPAVRESTMHTTPPSTEGPNSVSIAASHSAAGPSRYRAVQFHARGGLGEVHLAEDTELKRTVALKQIRPQHADDEESRRRFLVEAEITARLEHPGIVPVYGLVEDEIGRPQYAMRFIEGESLHEAIQRYHADKKRPERERRLAFRQLISRLVDVSNTIAYAHSRGVIHRDLKPENVMLGKFGETLVVDWGIAKTVTQNATAYQNIGPGEITQRSGWYGGDKQQTELGRAMGTPAFMSPEQAAGRWDVLDHRTDVFALGAMLYDLLTGHAPTSGDDATEVLDKVQRGDFPPPRQRKRDVPTPLDAICVKAMSLKPEDRYASALELASDLEQWLADEAVSAYREPWTVRCGRWLRRHRALVSSSAALLLTAIIGLTIGLIAVKQQERRAVQAEVEANERRAQAEAATADAKRERKQAVEQAKLALGSLSKVVLNYHENLRMVAGASTARRKLLRQALQDLENVSKRVEVARQASHVTIWAHLHVGEVYQDLGGGREEDDQADRKTAEQQSALQKARAHFEQARAMAAQLAQANPNDAQAQNDLLVSLGNLGNVHKKLGDTTAALQHYQDSFKIAQKLAQADPNDTKAQHNLAASRIELGDLQKQLGDTKIALQHYLDSHAIIQKLAQGDPNDAQTQRALAASLSKLGDIHKQLADTKTTLHHYQDSHSINQKLAQADPQDAQAQRDLAASFNRLGDVHLQLGDTKTALRHHQNCHKIIQKLAQADPQDARARRELSISLISLGDVERRLGNTKTALAHYQDSHKVFLTLAQADPQSTEAQDHLAGSHERLGDVHEQLGDTKAALRHYEDCHRINEKLAQGDPNDAQAQRDLSTSHERLGRVHKRLGNTKTALRHYQECHKIDQKLAQANPNDAKAQRGVSISLNKLGNVRRLLGETEAALRDYQESHRIRQELAHANPTDAQAQRDLSTTHTKLGEVRLLMGETKAALRHFEEGLKIRQKLAQADPSDELAQRNVSFCHEMLGNVQMRLGDNQAARRQYEDSLMIRQKLAQADPSNARGHRDVSVSLEKVGSVLMELGDAKAALRHFEDSLTIRQKLAQASPNSAEAQRDLSISLSNLGDVQLRLGDTQAARRHYQDCHKIMEKLAQLDPENARAQVDVSISHTKLGILDQEQIDYVQARSRFEKALAILQRLEKQGKTKGRPQVARQQQILKQKIAVCQVAEESIGDLEYVLGLPAQHVARFLAIRAQVLAKRGKHEAAIETAEKLATLMPVRVNNLYNAACLVSLCVPAVEKDKEPEKLSEKDKALREKYAQRAVVLLKQAIDKGYKDVKHIKHDKDLDPIRARKDFQELLKKLEAKQKEG